MAFDFIACAGDRIEVLLVAGGVGVLAIRFHPVMRADVNTELAVLPDPPLEVEDGDVVVILAHLWRLKFALLFTC
jgi:hypothetical protein